MSLNVEPELRSIPLTRYDCGKRGQISRACLVRFDCKTGRKLKTYLKFCDALCEQFRCPRGFP